MKSFLTNVRFWILVFAFLYSFLIFKWTDDRASLVRFYALSATGFLYVTLLIGPAVHIFDFLPYKASLVRARRATGVSSFYFAALHASIAYFGLLGGFAGLTLLPIRNLLAVIFGFCALMILSAMAATSFDYMVKKLTYKRWKFLHRFVYLAGTLIVAHAFLIGTHFQNLNSPVALISIALLTFLLIVEVIAWRKYLSLSQKSLAKS